jgi:hypothetical protein
MAFCKTAERLYAAIPLRPLSSLLIRVHMEKCPRCQARLLSREEARGLLVAPGELGHPSALWGRIFSGAGGLEARPSARPALYGAESRWAAVAAVTAVVIVTGFWLLRVVERPAFDARVVAPAGRFELEYVNVGGMPAQTFVFQPQGTDTVFVWASRIP